MRLRLVQTQCNAIFSADGIDTYFPLVSGPQHQAAAARRLRPAAVRYVQQRPGLRVRAGVDPGREQRAAPRRLPARGAPHGPAARPGGGRGRPGPTPWWKRGPHRAQARPLGATRQVPRPAQEGLHGPSQRTAVLYCNKSSISIVLSVLGSCTEGYCNVTAGVCRFSRRRCFLIMWFLQKVTSHHRTSFLLYLCNGPCPGKSPYSGRTLHKHRGSFLVAEKFQQVSQKLYLQSQQADFEYNNCWLS